MGNAAKIGGFVLIAIGAIWVLQGLNLLGGSFMSGHRRWIVIGALTAAAGAFLLLRSNRQPR